MSDAAPVGDLSEKALATLRRDAIDYRVSLVGRYEESTPEGLWYADQRRLDDALRRKADRICWELTRDFDRLMMWQVFHGPDSTPPPLPRDMHDGLTPEQFYDRELRW